jgi:electron transfer flavoprotein alpha subunit
MQLRSTDPLSRPLRIASLAKQIPVTETLTLGDNGRLVRQGLELEMNAYCRRAVSKGVELARATGGSCTVFTLGPPSAEDVLREAVAWGADSGVHLCDPAFEGSDTLATARALSAALRSVGPFDLILVGRNSLDGETGQVGPEIAQLLDLPFATGVRSLDLLEGGGVRAELEVDDGSQDVEIDLPAVLSVAERLCEPCKVDPIGRAAVAPERMARRSAADLGQGPWGDEGSPTKVGDIRSMVHERARLVLHGDPGTQVAAAVAALVQRHALTPTTNEQQRRDTNSPLQAAAPERTAAGPVVAVLVEHDRLPAGVELVGAAADLAAELGGSVHALCPPGTLVEQLAAAGADLVVELLGSRVAEDVADELMRWVAEQQPWAMLAPSTAFGREVAARIAAATGAGLVGDAIELRVDAGRLVSAKPAFAGALVADITCRSELQLATVRPGVLPLRAGRDRQGAVTSRTVPARGRVRVLAERRNDNIEALARAAVVIGVGTGVGPDEYDALSPLAAVLGAELAATRKVTDKGWAPRSRQIGITGRALAPRLYVAIGLSGKFNHLVGVRSAGTILAINHDPDALVFDHCDVGIVGDWHDVIPPLTNALRQQVHALSG